MYGIYIVEDIDEKKVKNDLNKWREYCINYWDNQYS